MAQHYARAGRVLVIVDTVKLVRQLAETIEWWTGTAPGIEMGEQRAELAAMGIGGLWEVSKGRIVCATVQTLYSGDEGNERFRKFDPADFSAVLLDECLVGSTEIEMA